MHCWRECSRVRRRCRWCPCRVEQCGCCHREGEIPSIVWCFGLATLGGWFLHCMWLHILCCGKIVHNRHLLGQMQLVSCWIFQAINELFELVRGVWLGVTEDFLLWLKFLLVVWYILWVIVWVIVGLVHRSVGERCWLLCPGGLSYWGVVDWRSQE